MTHRQIVRVTMAIERGGVVDEHVIEHGREPCCVVHFVGLVEQPHRGAIAVEPAPPPLREPAAVDHEQQVRCECRHPCRQIRVIPTTRRSIRCPACLPRVPQPVGEDVPAGQEAVVHSEFAAGGGSGRLRGPVRRRIRRIRPDARRVHAHSIGRATSGQVSAALETPSTGWPHSD